LPVSKFNRYVVIMKIIYNLKFNRICYKNKNLIFFYKTHVFTNAAHCVKMLKIPRLNPIRDEIVG